MRPVIRPLTVIATVAVAAATALAGGLAAAQAATPHRTAAAAVPSPARVQPATPPTCTTSWANPTSGDWRVRTNWTDGVPTTGSVACITVAGTYTVTLESIVHEDDLQVVDTLELGGTSGTQTLVVDGNDDGNTNNTIRLTPTNGGTIGSNGRLRLTTTCEPAQGNTSCDIGASSAFGSLTGGTLVNDGTISTDPGTDSARYSTRYLEGPISNDGTISVDAPTQYDGRDFNGDLVQSATLTNHGTITVDDDFTFDLPNNAASTIVDGSGGSIRNTGTPGVDARGAMFVDEGNTFDQDAGTISPATADPAEPAVMLRNATLTYTGSGAGTIVLRGDDTLTGDVAAHQDVVVQSFDDDNTCEVADTIAASAWSNAGHVLLTQLDINGGGGSCGTLLRTTAGTFTNSGTVETENGTVPHRSYLEGDVANTGTFQLDDAATQFDGIDPLNQQRTGDTLDNKGAITLATGAGLDLTRDSSATFVNDTGGSISNGSGTGQVFLDNGNSFTEGAGTISTTATDPASPAVLLSGADLTYSGSGAGTIVYRGEADLTGSIAATQALVLQAYDDGGTCEDVSAIEPAAWTNAGHVLLTQLNAPGAGGACGVVLRTTAGTLTNSGTIQTADGAEPSTRYLEGDLTNTGTIAIGATNSQYDGIDSLNQKLTGGTLDNKGAITLADGTTFALTNDSAASVLNETGGSISNGSGTGQLSLGVGNSFTEGAGTISTTDPDPATPAVDLYRSDLTYTGSGAGTIVLRGGGASLTGNIAAGQSLDLLGLDNGGSCDDSHPLATHAFTNAGTITLTQLKLGGTGGGCTAILDDTGTITNTGTIRSLVGGDGSYATRYLYATVVNRGTLDVESSLGVRGGSFTLGQSAGTSHVAAGQTLDLSQDEDQTLSLNGGSLTGDGTVMGSLSAAGGVVAPGSVGTVGQLTVSGNYSQGSGATLAADVDGTTAGTGFDQVSVGGTATIAGRLAANLVPGFTPTTGEAFPVVASGGALSGAFGSVTSTGSTTFTASYDANHANAVVTEPAATTTTLSLPSSLTYRHEQATPLRVTVHATTGTPTGTVTIHHGGTVLCTITLSGGAGHCTLGGAALAPGKASLTATYAAASGFTGSSRTATLTIRTTPTSTALKLSRTTISRSGKHTLTLSVKVKDSVSATATGKVRVKNGSHTLCTITLKHGKGHCTISRRALKKGKHTLVAKYAGTSTFGASTSAGHTVTVKK